MSEESLIHVRRLIAKERDGLAMKVGMSQIDVKNYDLMRGRVQGLDLAYRLADEFLKKLGGADAGGHEDDGDFSEL